MQVELTEVDHDLFHGTIASVIEVAQMVGEVDPTAETTPIGSSVHLGSLTKGDIDVLVAARAAGFGEVVSHLDHLGERAQSDNWTDDFASFTVPCAWGAVGVQVTVAGSELTDRLQRQAKLLEEAEVRTAYDAVKRDAAPNGPDAYWRAKDRFWQDLHDQRPDQQAQA